MTRKRGLLAVMLVAGMALCLPAAQAEETGEVRALYVPSFSTNTLSASRNIVENVLNSNLNQVYVQVRSRGDAYYYPNRMDSTYPNPEPRGQLYSISPADLDILQYYIDRLHNADPPVEVHAWVTVYNSWNRDWNPPSPDHIFNAHPEWRTYNRAGQQYGGGSDDGALDPALPEVQDHLLNVYMDIVRNYDVDGIHLDYIRLTNQDAGFHPEAKARFERETGWNFDTDNPNGELNEVYRAWRRDKVAELVQRLHNQVMIEKPWVDVSAFLVAFTDQVRNLAQGYNWWVAQGAIDTLHPSVYSSTVSGAESRWNGYLTRLGQNDDEHKRPLVAAVGSYLHTQLDPPRPERNVQTVEVLRGKDRAPDGFNFFATAAIFNNGAVTPRDLLARELFGEGGPMAEWVDVPIPPHKQAMGMDRVPPNPPASLSASISEGLPRVTFTRPDPGMNGRLPVRYRIYRDTKAEVDLYWDNLVMEWWDPGSARAAFEFVDPAAPSGSLYYKAVAFDEWNNRAVSPAAGPVEVAVSGGPYIIETRAGGHNVEDYSETGSFSNSTAHSTAAGTTPDIGSRFATRLSQTDGGDVARFTPSGLAAGEYQVFVTSFNYSSANAQGITVRLSDVDGVRELEFDLTRENAGDAWAALGTMTIEPGAGHHVEFDNSTQTNIGTTMNSRMNAAAVLFEPALAFELKPPVSEPPPDFPIGGEVIVDSGPHMLHWDGRISASPDNGKWQLNNTYSGYYNTNARYVAPASYPPFDQYAVWVVDLPRAGRWAIDGHVRDNTIFARGARYRFVDGGGIVRDTVASQRSSTDSHTTGGWHINVDGLEPGEAYYFDRGRVYVTIYGNAASDNEFVIADALRFTLLEAEEEPVRSNEWVLH